MLPEAPGQKAPIQVSSLFKPVLAVTMQSRQVGGLNMQRRDFIALLGSAAALPIAAIDAEADLGLTGIELGS